MGITVGISFLRVTEPEIPYCMLFMNLNIFVTGFCGRHFGFPGGTRVAKNVPFCSPIIFRKSRQSVPLNSERFRNGSKNIGLGVILPPPPGQGRVKGDSAENRKDRKLSCRATQPVLNRPRLKLGDVIRS